MLLLGDKIGSHIQLLPFPEAVVDVSRGHVSDAGEEFALVIRNEFSIAHDQCVLLDDLNRLKSESECPHTNTHALNVVLDKHKDDALRSLKRLLSHS